mmetsp:Transcript_21172/g.86462  ORF Transcript_21172/g.86462 Transcript_21172/m.86462 type:complete len:235 (-) Transcript_21172:1327-2031(-)
MSNHESAETLAKAYDLPFVFVDVSRIDKSEGEILNCVAETTDLLVLARYMQILSSDFLDSYKKPIINIHHGLLPAFKVGAMSVLLLVVALMETFGKHESIPHQHCLFPKRTKFEKRQSSRPVQGARPYHQMYEAGVKIIGATAHYVSPQLDDGPIIHQDVAPVNHRMSIAELKQVREDHCSALYGFSSAHLVSCTRWALAWKEVLSYLESRSTWRTSSYDSETESSCSRAAFTS